MDKREALCIILRLIRRSTNLMDHEEKAARILEADLSKDVKIKNKILPDVVWCHICFCPHTATDGLCDKDQRHYDQFFEETVPGGCPPEIYERELGQNTFYYDKDADKIHRLCDLSRNQIKQFIPIFLEL